MSKIVVLGSCPSLKNAKVISVNPRTGARFIRTEDRVKTFMDDVKAQIEKQWIGEVKLPVCITYVFWNKDARKHDLENQIATMNDCIKEFIGDDDQFHIEEVVGRYGGIDEEKPRVEIWID